MTIAKRILLLLSVAIAALLLLGGIGLYEQQQGKERFDAALDNLIPSVRDLNQAIAGFMDSRSGVTHHLLARSAEEKKAAEDEIAAGDKKIDAALNSYEKNDIANDADRKLLADDRSTLAAYRAGRQKLLADSGVGNQELQQSKDSVAETTKAFRKALNDHFDFNLAYAEQIRKDNTQAYHSSLAIAGGVFLLAVALTLALGLRILSTVRSRLQEMSATMREISRSLDLTKRMQESGDEIGQASRAFNELAQRLQGNLGSLLQGAHEVAAAAQSLSQTSSQVAGAAASQSEASANVAATIEQMTVSVNHVADRAQQTLTLAASAGSQAREGSTTITQTIADIRQISRAVDEAAGGIRELDQFSRQVNAVVGVIKDIADQTNLLALNASIEAARAGEMGRGFAVVADEVRLLAERTTASTKEIGSTISAMQQRTQQASSQMQSAEELVRNGVERADGADQAIQNIGRATQDTAGMVGDISSAIKEQGVATNNIAQQVEGIAQMSEQSNAAAQETAGSAQRLDRLARGQIETLSSYRL